MAAPYGTSPGGGCLHHIIHNGGPLPLHWWGWHTTTHTLEREGWQILVDEKRDLCSDTHIIQLGAKSPDNKMIITGRFPVPYREFMSDNYYTNSSSILEHIFNRGVSMQVYTCKDTIYHAIGESDFERINALIPVDVTKPTSFQAHKYPFTFKCFEPMEENPTKEIYIPSNSVDECLNRILQLQYPQQQDIKKSGLLVPEKQPIIQAKIFSLAA